MLKNADLMLGVATIAAVVCSMAAPAAAVISFDSPRVLSTLAASDDPNDEFDNERAPWVTGDGEGNWVAVWEGAILLPGADINVVTSSDNGATWSSPALLNTDAGVDTTGDSDAVVTTNRNGTWIAAWSRGIPALMTARSTDDGATWSAPLSHSVSPPLRGYQPCLETDGVGTWVLGDDGFGRVGVELSNDDGQNWASAILLDSDDPSNTADDFDLTVATDRTGNWVAAWRRSGAVMSARSSDNGATWSSPITVGSVGLNNSINSPIATDGLGNWVIVWETLASYNENVDLSYAVSTNNGATWSAPALLLPTSGTDIGQDTFASLQVGSDGTFYVVYRVELGDLSGKDEELYFSRSVDGGVTWTSPAALNLLGRNDDADDFFAHLGYDGDKSWVAVWESRNTLGGTIGSDIDILFARAHDDCPTTPAAGCRTPTEPGRSRITIKDGGAGSDKLTWRWSAGQQTTLADFGDPTTTSSYALCIYDKPASVLRPVFEADAAAASMCAGTECWQGDGDSFTYSDSGQSNGSIRSIRLTPGEDGRARIQVRANGLALGPPRLPLAKDPSVRVQLINTDNGNCWEATYSTATSNDASRFKANSD